MRPLLAATLLLVAVAPAPDELAARLSTPRVAAHRGGYGAPDSNTIARFEISRAQGADIVETDLRLSKDGVVYLFHNELMDKVTSCLGPFASHTSAEIDACHLTGLDRGPDRFEDALRWARGRVVIDAELKTPDVSEAAIDLVRHHSAYDWVYFQVGNGLSTYERVRRYDKRVALEAAPRGAKGERFLKALLAKHDRRLLIIQLHPDFYSRRILQAVRDGGKRTSMNAWMLAPETESASCDAAYARGIDIAVTNAPQSCVTQRDRMFAAPSAPAPSPAPTR